MVLGAIENPPMNPPNLPDLLATCSTPLHAYWDSLKAGAAALPAAAAAQTIVGGKALFGWLKTKLTRPSSLAAIAEVEADPHAADNRDNLLAQLKRELAHNPALAGELCDLLGQLQLTPTVTHTQTATHPGTGHIVQIAGNQNNPNLNL